jgi:hypothetical protein
MAEIQRRAAMIITNNIATTNTTMIIAGWTPFLSGGGCGGAYGEGGTYCWTGWPDMGDTGLPSLNKLSIS